MHTHTHDAVYIKGLRIYVMPSLQDEYDSIVAQLDGFLNSTDLAGAIECITSATLEEKIKEIDDKWTGLRERAPVTLERLRAVVNTIRQGLFCGEGHIFYIQVRNMRSETHSEYLYPSKNIENIFHYLVPDHCVYAIDIKDLSGNTHTPNLYVYESDGTLVSDMQNPFNLTAPRVRGDKGSGGHIKKYLAYGVRLYAFGLDAKDNTLELTLKNESNRTVLKLQFDHASVDTRASVNFLLGELLQTCS